MVLPIRRRVSTAEHHDPTRLVTSRSSIGPPIRIAVVDPYGAGKTSVVEILEKRIAGSRVIYGRKNRDRLLVTTALGLRLWHTARMARVPGLAQAVRFAVFYSFEYLENLARARVGEGSVVIYDRDPVDRMVMAADFRCAMMGQDARGMRKLRVVAQYSLLWLLRVWYMWLYPRFDLLGFLLPAPDLLVECGGNQYSSARRAEAKRQAYAEVARALSRRQRVLVIDMPREMSLEEVAGQIMLAVRGDKRAEGKPHPVSTRLDVSHVPTRDQVYGASI